MGLSSDLISQFVKSNKEEKQKSENSALIHGTAKVKSDGSVSVIMDGSNIETPATSTTSVKDGERVLVTIKNHSAIITGNTTSPSSSVLRLTDADGNTIDTINIDSLVTENAIIKERLTVSEADIDTLQANSVTTDKLEADYIKADAIEATYLKTSVANSTYATIANLDATNAVIYSLDTTYAKISELDAAEADIEQLKADYAKIDELYATEAEISDLKADVANIDTLIFGSATGDVIQTSFSNAVIAQLGDAQIKSAMIESISAGKITAGDIITNNVRVMSEDGKLVISDETLQISDSSRVRVQIGKDESDDYSINIWDQNGNLMFSKGGITDAAIKEAIIRNDMVSDTANIHASKLDIDSLFEEINDSSNTIKSTKVYLDEEKQTLDVAFKSLTTEVTEQGETISSQGTAISTIQGQISTKVWQQDIDTATDEMTTKYSTLEQEVDSFKTTVSSTYSTKSEISDLKIGGRNLILSSDRLIDNNSYKIATYVPSSPLVAGEKYTVSMCVTPAEGVSYYEAYVSSGYTVLFGLWPTGTDKQIISKTFTAKYNSGRTPSDDITHANIIMYRFPNDNTITTNSIIHWIKVEKGDKATDWTPAPEDVETKIVANQTLIEQTAADLTVRIESSAKTATNYLNFSSSGLVIGDLTADTLGKNVLIDSDSVDIRNGDVTLASFGADYLYLAKNSRNAKIDLCNGLATMYHESKYSYDTIFIIDTGNTTEIMGLINPLCVTSVDDSDEVSIQFANANGVMGGIGIVGSWLRRYGSNMYDKYTILDSGNYHDVMDSGWHYGGVLGENFTIYSDNDQIQYRKIGKVVNIRGAVKPTTTVSGSTDNHLIFTLPEGYRPSSQVIARCQGSGCHTWLLSITTSGQVRFARYGNGSNYVDAPDGTWLPFNVTFFVD